VSLHKEINSETRLILRGTSLGIRPQIENVTTDGFPLNEESGTWLIPAHTLKLRWEIPLLEVSEIDASQQQSVRCEDFVLISELSSIPRLEGMLKPPTLKIVMDGVRTMYPPPTPEKTLSLHSNSERPLFILINGIEIKSLSTDFLTLSYLVDRKGMDQFLPDMSTCMKGLKWLTSLVCENEKEENFTLGWCGAKRMAIAGAAGYGVLLVNYPTDKMRPLDNALLLYVPFHEAFHQLSGSAHSTRPTWAEESLASYYGSRAVKVALSGDSEASQLIDEFQKRGEKFIEGLIAINHQVNQGNRLNYGAFYTKGVSFWLEIEKVLHEQGDTLDHHIKSLLHLKYDSEDKPVGLMELLGIPREKWIVIATKYLD